MAPSEEVMPAEILVLSMLQRRECTSPCVLDRKTEVVLSGELHRHLNVLNGARIDANDGHASLMARNTEGDVQVASINGAVRKRERLEVGLLHCAWLIRPKVAISLVGDNNGTFGRVRVDITGLCERRGMDERVRDVLRQRVELGLGGPAIVAEKAAALCRIGRVPRGY